MILPRCAWIRVISMTHENDSEKYILQPQFPFGPSGRKSIPKKELLPSDGALIFSRYVQL